MPSGGSFGEDGVWSKSGTPGPGGLKNGAQLGDSLNCGYDYLENLIMTQFKMHQTFLELAN